MLFVIAYLILDSHLVADFKMATKYIYLDARAKPFPVLFSSVVKRLKIHI